MKGTVRWFNAEKKYGFIAPAMGDKDIFVHISALQKSGLHSLSEGMSVEFDTEQGKKGMQATNVRLG